MQKAKNKIALIYDFDGTLSPKPMQEYTILPKLGISPEDFWKKVGLEAKSSESEPMLVYMRLLLEEAEKAQVHIGRQDFVEMGKQIEYFEGVESWFCRIEGYIQERSQGLAQVAHYIISAGNKEILEGVSIANRFEKIYASEYHYDHHNQATFPKLLITDTSKTQFIFRINKGKLDIREDINSHMPYDERPIPFSNIIYIGDGLTDVPSMAVVKHNGGHAVAVHRPVDEKAKDVCETLLKAKRVNFFAPANFSEGSELDRKIKLLLDKVIAAIAFTNELTNPSTALCPP
ncbi:MAG: HAD family hydrolase [SAR324 cluster bacterium]|nr:HAD family hydrolase [SAR324 cluster bacterium]